MKTKTRSQLDNEKDLLKFYEKRSKEPAGGKFFAVFKDGTKVSTEWGRSLSEVCGFLQQTQIHNRKFDSFNKQVPGNVQFTKVVRLF